MKEAIRYLDNAKEILKKASVEDGIYTDIKPVREAFGTAYLAVHNGKLLKEFESLYDLLYIAGYYRKLLNRVDIVKDALKAVKTFFDKIG